MDKNLTRRDMLSLATALAGATVAASPAMAAVCAKVDGEDASLRQSLHYVEVTREKDRCAACNFFNDPKGDCGTCTIFSGPANANGRCDSWSART